ncbi:MAG: 4-phosphoerythronate dehydrogenase [Gammaproteobacteria bacterium]|nr:4-phosphoerythronate dehydrogenase [Gammaproteobacteria bacterium]
MIVVADQNIPCAADAFADFGEVRLLPGRDIRNEDLRECSCLVTRTVTRVDAALLEGTPVEFVGSATIGTDHVDRDYLAQRGITFSNAAGCNAEAAAEYVISGLYALSVELGFDPRSCRAGIVGCGNVGSRLAHKFDALGIEYCVNDPPLAKRDPDARAFVELDELVATCDLISLHVPLADTGAYPTRHLFDAALLRSLRPQCLLINAARGPVIDNTALLALLDERDDLRVFLDTWEGEPRVMPELLRRVQLATPHIAGYSVEGRLRGTQMVLDAACARFGIEPGWNMAQEIPAAKQLQLVAASDELAFWQRLFTAHFDIRRDHAALIASAELDDSQRGGLFESLRRVYPDRLEYPRWRISAAQAGARAQALAELGFAVEA